MQLSFDANFLGRLLTSEAVLNHLENSELKLEILERN